MTTTQWTPEMLEDVVKAATEFDSLAEMMKAMRGDAPTGQVYVPTLRPEDHPPDLAAGLHALRAELQRQGFEVHPPDSVYAAQALVSLDDQQARLAAEDALYPQVASEVVRARRAFPRNTYLLHALQEEVGELTKAALHHCVEDRPEPENLRAELIQIMAVCVRLWTEGDPSLGEAGLPPIGTLTGETEQTRSEP